MSDAFFFGESERPLYGIYHAPSLACGEKSEAILLCQAIGQEYIRSHRAVRQLAREFASAGHHVLRFDYSGTGDSWGTLDQVGLQRWRSDINLALTELRDISGADRLTMLGLRFGALLAATTKLCGVDALILWEPVVDGSVYLRELRVTHEAMLRDVTRFGRRRRSVSEGELLGFSYPGALLREIACLKSQEVAETSVRDVGIFATEESVDIRALKACFKEAGCAVRMHSVGDYFDWRSPLDFGKVVVPAETIRAIVCKQGRQGE